MWREGGAILGRGNGRRQREASEPNEALRQNEYSFLPSIQWMDGATATHGYFDP